MIENDLKNIESWSKQWVVKFNASKTESFYITRKPVDLFLNFSFEQQLISNAQQHKHLGLIISKDLSWKIHLITICHKAAKRVDMLKSLRYKLDRKTLEIIYLSFIRPLLEYGDVVWDNTPRHEKYYTDLEKMQIDAMLTVCGYGNYSSKSLLYADTNWQLLSTRHKFHRLILCFKKWPCSKSFKFNTTIIYLQHKTFFKEL